MDRKTTLLEFGKYVSLSVIAMLAVSCYILADTFFVSKSLGTRGLAALNLAIPAYNFIHGTGLMLGMGGATRYAVCKSRGEDREGDLIFTDSFRLSLAASLFFVILGLLASEALTGLLGADEEIFDMTRTYLQVMLLFAPAFILNDLLVCFVRNDGDPRLAMIATAAGSIANIFLDYFFMFPLGMGIFGAVFATGLSPVIGILILLPHWMKKTRGFHLVKASLSGKRTGIIFSLGFPSLLGQFATGIVMIVFNAIILGLTGNTGVAAYGVIANISLVVVGIYTGMAQGIQPLVSREYGRGNRRKETAFLRYDLWAMVLISLALYALLFFFADPITAVFNSEGDEALQKIASEGLKIYFTSMVFVGYNIIISMYFTSVERALPAHIISLLRGFVLIVPMAFLLSALLGMWGVWLTFPATELLVFVAGVCLYGRFQRTRR